ncbi:hypothetical protein [Pseudoteredinibacter isoporae]|uniref:Uncharacterized protein n=1 Tax=Pseudoteredinibacter isoporae TaxID=570281 RepID=A0A7X0MUX8_9GAMM|nr:hypothetical protein [Pseudoteredinibacter isoporae]MBB6520773.1 hypothetical protein [Pseudoteredinibacter isoporae]NHO86339.1 hypothetical protein [Pseudoteredinibacter isoporae]NIB25209.1 hypothetical protein [Pseudoteredinibacter isoporae]
MLARCIFICSVLFYASFHAPVLKAADPYLWLPTSYKGKLPQLKQAVDVARENPRCSQVLKGTVNVDLSSQQVPVFKILCRDDERKTFSLLLDGTSFKTYDRTKSRFHKGPSERSMREFWTACNKAVADMYEDFRTIRVLTRERPEPTLYKDATVGIAIDFDAVSLIGERLAFRAECIFTSGTSYRLKLTGREVDAP